MTNTQVFDETIKLADNAMLRKRPDLFNEWDFEKNRDVSIYEITSGQSYEAHWICSKCTSPYQSMVFKRVLVKDCFYCAGRRVNHTNSLAVKNPSLASQWHPTRNGDLTPHDVTSGKNTDAWWLCDKGHSWKEKIGIRNLGAGCGTCNNSIILIGYNDLWTTNIPLSLMLLNPEDGYKYARGSNTKVRVKCLNCNSAIGSKRISDYQNRVPICNVCDDRKSIGEKIMHSLLLHSSLNFNSEKMFSWSGLKRYDFYVPDYNMIIEMHGIQHFETINRKGARTLQEEQENDRYKEQLAKDNGIEHYVIIDCRVGEFNYIKQNIINSDILSLLDLKAVSWEDILKLTSHSLLIRAKDLYNSGLNTTEIMRELNLSRVSITTYLNKSTKYGWCDYDGKKALSISSTIKNKKLKKPITQLSIGNEYIKTWESASDIQKEWNKDVRSSIRDCCKGKNKTAYGFKWMYLSDYEAQQETLKVSSL